MKYLQSFARFPLHLPALGELPTVTIPKGHYTRREIEQGACPVIALTDLQVERIKKDRCAMQGFEPDLNGNRVYRWLSRMPSKYLDMKRVS
jgi:hypothetical protein